MLNNGRLNKETFKKLGIEIISMVMAVLIALAANSWWMNRTLQSNADEAVELMNKEVVENYQKSKSLLPKVVKRIEKIITLEKEVDNTKGFDNYLTSFNGFSVEIYQKNAWLRLTQSDFSSFIDSKYISRAFTLQGDIDKMKVIWDNITNLITNEILYEPSKAKSAYKISRFLLEEEKRWIEVMNENYEQFIIDFMPEKAVELEIKI